MELFRKCLFRNEVDGVIITHANSRGMGVDVNSGGKLVMSKGAITGNIDGNGGIRVKDGGTFTMSGGTISNNTAYVAGGGVYNAGTFTMSGAQLRIMQL